MFTVVALICAVSIAPNDCTASVAYDKIALGTVPLCITQAQTALSRGGLLNGNAIYLKTICERIRQ